MTALQGEVDRSRQELEQSRQRAGELESQATAAAEEASSLRSELADRDGRLATIESELTRARGDLDTATRRVGELETSLSAATTAPDQSERVASLERTIVERDAEIASLRSELAAAAPAPSPGAWQQAGPAAAGPEADLPSKDEATARVAEIARRTAGDGPVDDDDLKQVKGIGPKIEGILKSLGISSFRQVARFEPDDIAYVTAALDAFPGRIERDDWMSQASALHRDTYGEEA
jgi:NADH-quinone oxidoreductase subunit E